MEPYDVRFLEEALDDLEEIILYIAQNSPSAALRMHDAIMKKANTLSGFPKLGRPVPDAKMAKAGYRTLLIKPYIAFYRVIEHSVFIYRVIHGATNYPMLYEKMSQVNSATEDEGG
jgi:plasmid stabilization system protein ParE